MNCILIFSDRVSVPLTDIISVNPVLSNTLGDNETNQGHQLKCFTVIYAKRSKHSSNANKWRHHTISLFNNDFRIVSLWIRTLQTAIEGRLKILLYYNNDILILFVILDT